MSGKLSTDRSQYTYEISRSKGLLFGEQRSTMAGKVCLSDDDCWGNCLILIAVLKPTVLHLYYTPLWAYKIPDTVHPQLHLVGTTGKRYSTTVCIL